jgi:hypothetical protein
VKSSNTQPADDIGHSAVTEFLGTRYIKVSVHGMVTSFYRPVKTLDWKMYHSFSVSEFFHVFPYV